MGEVGVVAVAIGAGVVVVAIAVAAAVRWRGARDAQSVAGYRQTLDVLGHLGGGDRRLRVRTSHEPDREERGPEDPRRGPDPAALRALDDRTGRRDRSLAAMDRPAHGLGVPLLALVLVLAVGGAAAYAVVRAHHAGHPHGQSAGSHGHGHTSAPTTTLPPRYTAVSTTSSSATYAPRSTAYSLTVGATTTACWMSVTSSTGTVVLEQTFAAGASASVSLSGRSSILIGAPKAAEISIGGVPVVLPSAVVGPLTVTLVPA